MAAATDGWGPRLRAAVGAANVIEPPLQMGAEDFPLARTKAEVAAAASDGSQRRTGR